MTTLPANPSALTSAGFNRQTDRERSPSNGSLAAKLLIAGGVLLLVAAVGAAFAFEEQVLELRGEVASLGLWGVVGFVLVFALWTLTTVPAIPLMAFAGLLWGPWEGTLYSVLGGLIGSSATFWLGRWLGQGPLRRWKERSSKLEQMMRLVERHSIAAIMLVRAVAVFPLTLLNYGFGATKMKFWTYLGVSAVMMVPGASMYAGLGRALGAHLAEEPVSWQNLAWIAAFAAVGGALALYLRRRPARLGGGSDFK